MTQADINRLVCEAVRSGNWIIRTDNNGASHYQPEFRWQPVGEWTKAPDWNPAPECGGGLHGQGPEASGFLYEPGRVVFCETRGERVVIDDYKLKVPEARILLVNDLSPARGLELQGALDLAYCRGLTALPDDLSVGGALYLGGCTGLTALPDGLSVGGWLYLSRCTGLTALPEGLSVGGSLYLSDCRRLTSLPDGLRVGAWLRLDDSTQHLRADAARLGIEVML